MRYKFRFHFRCWRGDAEYNAKIDVIATDPDQAEEKAHEILKSHCPSIWKSSWHLQQMEIVIEKYRRGEEEKP